MGKIALVLLVGWVLAGGIAGAEDGGGLSLLRGMDRTVSVEVAGTLRGRGELDPEVVQEATADKLRALGFSIVDDVTDRVVVGVDSSHLKGAGLYAYAVRISLEQAVVLERDAELRGRASTWTASTVGTVLGGRVQQAVVTAIAGLLERFASDFALVNPDG